MFRFENLEIWKLSIDILDISLDMADKLTKKNLFRFAEQLRGATISISNNIAEGSACQSNVEFKKFLGYARRSAFEIANMIIVFHKRNYIKLTERDGMIYQLEKLCRMISGFMKTLSP